MATKKKKLQLKTVTYSRIKNIGNYENERVEAVAVVQPGEDPSEVLRGLKRFVLGSLGLEVKSKVREAERREWHGPVCICDECQ